MATISNNDIARAIYLATKDKTPAEQTKVIPNIIQFLTRRRWIAKVPDILSRLDKMINEAKGKVVAKISSKDQLHENTKREISHILKEKYSAKEVDLQEVLDEKLVGGFKIEVSDEVMDLTIKNKINKLQEYLTKSV
jgi:F-type H+-transporting ATPase subunit delta